MTDFYRALKELGKVFGIEESYTDNWGRTFLTRPDIAREILALKGITVNTDRMALDSQIQVISISGLPDCVNFVVEMDWNRFVQNCNSGKIIMQEVRGRLQPVQWDISNPSVCTCTDEETGLTSVSVPTPAITETAIQIQDNLRDKFRKLQC